MKNLMNPKNSSVMLALAMGLLFITQPAMAAGLDDIKGFLTEVHTALKGVGVIVVTIAFVIAGYKIIFGGQTVREVAPIVIGGLVIGAASYLAGLIIK